jgi:ABC-2 type transport system permease protein
MSKVFILTRVLLKNGNLGFSPSGRSGKRKIKTSLFLGLMILAFLPLALSFGFFTANSYEVLAAIGQEGLVMALALSLISFTVFFLGIFYVNGVFYFSQDIESLLPLPLKPAEILGAKLAVTLIFEYLSQLVFLLPVLIAFGFKSGGGILYFLYGLIVFLVFPLIPLILATLINMVVMTFTNLTKNKDRFRIVSGIIALFIAVGLNMFIQKFTGETTNPQELQRIIMEGNNSFANLVAGIFPSTRFAVLALINRASWVGLVNLIFLLLITLGFLGIFFLLGQRLYFRGVVGISEAASRRKRLSEEEFSRSTRQNSGIKSYTLKELRILFRTPTYFLNCILMNFLWPLFLIIPIMTQPDRGDFLQLVGSFISDEGRTGIVLAGAFVLTVFVSATNNITSTSISREGRNFFVLKYLPMSYEKQIMAKVLSGVAMGLVGLLVLIIAALVLLSPPLYLVLLTLIAGVIGIFLLLS